MLYAPDGMSLARRKIRGQRAMVLYLKHNTDVYDQRQIIMSIYAIYNTTLDTNPVFSSIFHGKNISKVDKREARNTLIKHGYISSDGQRRIYTAEGIPHTLEFL
ncbi:MAG: hypothetical protein EB127_20275 [Alphaproteobacteria bacterium]|nr:hypothetical protein [Alphaproteobacteria bacterium]